MRRMKATEKWGVVVVAALMLTAGIVNEDMTYNGKVVFDAGARVHLNGPWSIDGTEVTATAVNLNAGLASSTASLVSNAVAKLYYSNGVVVAGGTIALGQGVAVSGAGSTLTVSNVTQTAGATFTGLSVAGGTLTGTITNNGATIGAAASSGAFNLSNATQTAGGTFTGLSVAGGTIAGTVTNGGTISGGTVSATTLGAQTAVATVSNLAYAAISSYALPSYGAASNITAGIPPGLSTSVVWFVRGSVGGTNGAWWFSPVQ